MSNKVKYNVRKVHYAIMNEEGIYDTPIMIPGAVSISLEQQGELTPFYADGIKYWTSASSGGYEGDLEVALIPDSFRENVLGETLDTNQVLIEKSNAPAVNFALGFVIDGNEKPYYYWFYNCTATKPNIESSTTEETKEPSTDTLTISCAANEEEIIRAKTTESTSEETVKAWFNEVYIKDKGIETVTEG